MAMSSLRMSSSEILPYISPTLSSDGKMTDLMILPARVGYKVSDSDRTPQNAHRTRGSLLSTFCQN
jgi:hypothetical protein